LVVLCSVEVLVLHFVSGHHAGPGITPGTTLCDTRWWFTLFTSTD
jgi:hypothetical protein